MFLVDSISALLVVTSVLVLIRPGLSTDYCSKKICPEKKHIRCGNDGSFGKKCPKNAKVIPMTDELKRLIVDRHNEVRKGICEGNYNGLAVANRMIQMAWDDALAENAQYTAKTCVYAHDQCRNTEIYSQAGQNIAMLNKKESAKPDYKKIIVKIIDSWLSQKNNVANLVERFRSNSGQKADDFAQMIRASCGHIGCALVHFVADGMHNIFLVCNYSSANVLGEPVYEIGPACSACLSGCSAHVPGLCNTAEEKYYLLKLGLLHLVDLKVKDPLKLKSKLSL